MEMTEILFLGTSACTPLVGDDTASFLVGGELLIDLGWNAVHNLRCAGINPASIDCICFTHLHHDHMMSLPALLYYRIMHGTSMDTLKIFGPCESLKRPVADALSFLQTDKYWPCQPLPDIRPLLPEDSFETARFSIKAISSRHTVPGRCYRMEDKHTGVVIGFSGDTAYRPEYGGFFEGCDFLIHEYSYGLTAPEENKALHSSVHDAASVAAEAKAGALCLVHGLNGGHAASEAAVRQKYTGPVYWPHKGDRILLGGQ